MWNQHVACTATCHPCTGIWYVYRFLAVGPAACASAYVSHSVHVHTKVYDIVLYYMYTGLSVYYTRLATHPGSTHVSASLYRGTCRLLPVELYSYHIAPGKTLYMYVYAVLNRIHVPDGSTVSTCCIYRTRFSSTRVLASTRVPV